MTNLVKAAWKIGRRKRPRDMAPEEWADVQAVAAAYLAAIAEHEARPADGEATEPKAPMESAGLDNDLESARRPARRKAAAKKRAR